MHKFSNASTSYTLLGTDLLGSPALRLVACAPRRISYTPFGHAQVEGIGFTGQLREPLTGGYLLGNGYRGFYPNLMRFVADDSFSPFGAGGMNPYAYCQGSPINAADPTGHTLLSRVLRLVSKRRSYEVLPSRLREEPIGVIDEVSVSIIVGQARSTKPKTQKTSFYRYRTKNKKVSEGTALIYKGTRIESWEDAVAKTKHAWEHNQDLLNSIGYDDYKGYIEKHTTRLYNSLQEKELTETYNPVMLSS